MAWKNRFESEILQLKNLLSENEIVRQVNVSLNLIVGNLSFCRTNLQFLFWAENLSSRTKNYSL